VKTCESPISAQRNHLLVFGRPTGFLGLSLVSVTNAHTLTLHSLLVDCHRKHPPFIFVRHQRTGICKSCWLTQLPKICQSPTDKGLGHCDHFSPGKSYWRNTWCNACVRRRRTGILPLRPHPSREVVSAK